MDWSCDREFLYNDIVKFHVFLFHTVCFHSLNLNENGSRPKVVRILPVLIQNAARSFV